MPDAGARIWRAIRRANGPNDRCRAMRSPAASAPRNSRANSDANSPAPRPANPPRPAIRVATSRARLAAQTR
eukprot:7270010-Lingulodinium_polyedra.AAC.1